MENDKASPVVDTVFGLQTPEVIAMRPDWGPQFLGEKIGVGGEVQAGLSVAEHVDLLNRAGIDRALVLAQIAGSPKVEGSYSVPVDYVAGLVEQHPSRFRGLCGVDPTAGMAGLRHLEEAVSQHGFVGAHGYPHWFDLAPDDRRWYPIYAKCCELNIPIMLQVGHCLVYSKSRPLRSVGRPITLDTIACDFPELKLIGIHIGWPWTEEMISVAYKHENVYIASDAYAPKHWSSEFVRFIDSWGAGKVMFGTDFPVINPVRAMAEIATLPIRDSSRELFLGGVAAKLFPFD